MAGMVEILSSPSPFLAVALNDGKGLSILRQGS